MSKTPVLPFPLVSGQEQKFKFADKPISYSLPLPHSQK